MASKSVKWWLFAILLVALAALLWRPQKAAPVAKAAGPVQVIAAPVTLADVSARLIANGTVAALQIVEVRPLISATVTKVHVREGQPVKKGDRLFTLDARTENANLSRAEAQVAKDRSDLANAERNLERQRALLKQEYISQAEFDLAQNQADLMRGQLAIDLAAKDATFVARNYSEITAPISGRTGAIAVYPGSLVQPVGLPMLTIAQINPINVSFTLPERELAALQDAWSKGAVPVSAELDQPGQTPVKGHLVFIDNAVDMASGTIRLKAEFPNPDSRLWPGMFINVSLAPRTVMGALTVPVQAVQTGPEKKFLYVIGADKKVTAQTIQVRLIQDGYAVIEGVAPGARVVVEGAQNLRPGSVISEDRGQKTEDRGQRTEDRGQKTEDRGAGKR